jgi:hypothetical protein
MLKRSENILDEFRKRFKNGINEKIEKLILVQDAQEIYCELYFADYPDAEPRQVSLSDFEIDGKLLFVPQSDFEENLHNFLNLKDKFLYLLIGQLFNSEMKRRIMFHEEEFNEEGFGEEDFREENAVLPKKQFEISPEALFKDLIDQYNRQPLSKINPDGTFAAMKPQGSENYLQLSEILEDACKEPEIDEEGYSIFRPVFSKDNDVLSVEWYNLVTLANILTDSRLYDRYLDESTIIFREFDEQFLWFEPKENESIAFKYSGIAAYKIKKEYSSLFDLEYVYLMMKNLNFKNQFPNPINISTLISGWIPEIPYSDQKVFVLGIRQKQLNLLKHAIGLLER